MGRMLLSLHFTNQAEIQSKTGNAVTDTHQLSKNGLRADLMLTPDGDEELQKLGFVRLHVEAEPTFLADMTRQETENWLCDALVRMLTSKGSCG